MDTVLVFRIGSLGDTVVALPCFHRIEHSFPNARRIVITDAPASKKATPLESVLGDSGLIHEVIYFPPPPRKLGDLLDLRRQIRATRATTLIYVADRKMAETLRDLCFFRACGIRHIVGAPLARRLRKLRIDADGDTEREAERLARCLAPLGPTDLGDPEMWSLRLRPAEIDVAERALAPLRGGCFAAICVGGKVREKDWGDENWIALLRLLGEHHPNLALVFIGSADEFGRCAAYAALCSNPALNLCGQLTPRESAAAMKKGVLFIGHDSGPMHLAAAVGVPCVAMFGPVNMPKWWHPMGPRHRVLHDMDDVRKIAPADILAAIGTVLAQVARSTDRPTLGIVA